MTMMFDKFFPAGPEPDPARLALAREATMTMFPKGTYGQAMTGFVDQFSNRILDMSEAELLAMFPEEEKAEEETKGKKSKKKMAAKKEASKPKPPPSTEPLRVSLAKKEPLFDAKLAAIRAFAGTMIQKFGDVAEPKFREGMARAMARKFDAAQIAEIQTFLATPTGAAYGREMVGLWFQPDVIRGTFEALPEMMKLMPDFMKEAATFDAQFKALDKPADSKTAD
jgi:hypothetical protein